jgi:hypothetical protein
MAALLAPVLDVRAEAGWRETWTAAADSAR